MNVTLPVISVILIVGNRRERAERALGSILAQAGLEKAEVILIDAGNLPNLPPLPGSDHPQVRLSTKSERNVFGKMRAEAVRSARGNYVAFLEEHCVAYEGWLEGIVAALGRDWVAVGGEGHTANPDTGISDVIALMNYPRWRPPAQPGPSRMLPGQNSAYRRENLLAFGDDLDDLLQSEAVLQWRLIDQGHAIGIDPAIKFAHNHETTWRSAGRGLFWYCRCFGHTNARIYKWSLITRWVRTLLTPLMPFVRFGRYLSIALRERPQDLKILLRHAPTILMVDAHSAAGMAAGYLFGAGEAEMMFTHYELDEGRSKPA